MALPARKETRFPGMKRPHKDFLLTFVAEQLDQIEKADKKCARLLFSLLDALMIRDPDAPIRDLMSLAVASMPTSGRELAEWSENRDRLKRLCKWVEKWDQAERQAG